MTGQSKSDRTARSITAFMKSTERTKKCGTKDYIHWLIMWKKLKWAKHTNETKKYKRYQILRCETGWIIKMLNTENKEEIMLHLDLDTIKQSIKAGKLVGTKVKVK